MLANWQANHYRRHERRRQLRQRREQQERLNETLRLHPSRREGYGRLTDFPHLGSNTVWIERANPGWRNTEREVPYEPWMKYDDWIPWPHDPEADEYDRRMREEAEERERRMRGGNDSRARVCSLSVSKHSGAEANFKIGSKGCGITSLR